MKKIKGTEEAWDSGELGRSEAHVARVTLDDLSLSEALELKSISIRMPHGLLEDLKLVAEIHGMGYQPLIKQVLSRFVEAEKRVALQEKQIAIKAQNTADRQRNAV